MLVAMASERIERIRRGILIASGDIPKKQIADEIGCAPTTISTLIGYHRLGVEFQDKFEKWLREKSYWSEDVAPHVFRDSVREDSEPLSVRRRVVADLSTEDIMRTARDARKVNRLDLRDKLDDLADQVELIRDQLDEIRSELEAIDRQFKSYSDEVRQEYAKLKPTKPKAFKPKPPGEIKM